MPVRIRAATEADVDAIAEAHVDSILTLGPLAYDAAIVEAWAAPRTGESYLRAMRRGEVFFVAVDENAVLGFSSHRIHRDQHRTAIDVFSSLGRGSHRLSAGPEMPCVSMKKTLGEGHE